MQRRHRLAHSRKPRTRAACRREPTRASLTRRLTGPCYCRMLEAAFRAPEPGDEAAVAEAQRIMAVEDYAFAFDYAPGQDFSEWLERVEAERLGRSLAPGRVAATFEVALVEKRTAGRLFVRHALNDFLLQQGGHMGYGVLPAFALA